MYAKNARHFEVANLRTKDILEIYCEPWWLLTPHLLFLYRGSCLASSSVLCILAAFWLLSRPCRKARQSLGRGKFVESSCCWSNAPRWRTTKTEQSRVWVEWAWMEKYRNTRRFSMRWISLSGWKMTSQNHRELHYFEMIIYPESGQSRGDDFQSCWSVGSTPSVDLAFAWFFLTSPADGEFTKI